MPNPFKVGDRVIVKESDYLGKFSKQLATVVAVDGLGLSVDFDNIPRPATAVSTSGHYYGYYDLFYFADEN